MVNLGDGFIGYPGADKNSLLFSNDQCGGGLSKVENINFREQG